MLGDKLRTTTPSISPDIEFVGSYVLNESSGTSWTFTYGGNLTGGTDSTVQQGDLVFINIGGYQTAGVTFSNSSGFSGKAGASTADDQAVLTLRLFRKFMGATPDTSISVTSSASITPTFQAYVFRYTGQTAGDLSSTETEIKTWLSSGALTPGAVTPENEGSVVVVFAGFATYDGGSLGTVTNSGLDDFSTGGTTNVKVAAGVAQYDWTSGTVSPSAFDEVTDNGNAVSFTLYISPPN